MPDLDGACEQAVAALADDPGLGPFVGPGRSVLLWDALGRAVIWDSAAARALGFRYRDVTDESRSRLQALAAGQAPNAGYRLEQLRFGSDPLGRSLTFACRLVPIRSDVALLTALVEPSDFDQLDAALLDSSETSDFERAREGGRPARAPTPPVRFTPVRFTWRTGGDGRIAAVSPELSELVGEAHAAIVGLDWSEIGQRVLQGGDDGIVAAMAAGSAWSGRTVLWRVAGTATAVPVELGAMPAGRPGRDLDGFHGFGIGRPGAAGSSAEAVRAAPEPVAAGKARDGPELMGGHRRDGALQQPTAGEAPPVEEPSLSVSERGALHEIARALGARVLPAEAADTTSARATAEIVRLPVQPGRDVHLGRALDRLPIAVGVLRDATPIYANRALLDLAGSADLPGLVARRGLAALFGERLDGVALEMGEARLPLRAGGRKGAWVDLALSPVTWGDAPASLVSIRPAPEVELAQRIGALELEVAAGGRALDEARATLDAAADGILVVDDTGRILSANGPVERLFGYARNEITGDIFTALIRPEDHVAALAGLDAARGGEDAAFVERELRGRSGRGGTPTLLMRVGRMAGRDGPLYAVTFRDGSRAKLAERTLRDAKLAAEHASARQIEFLARISHEIRTPLNAITGFAEFMLEERFGPIGSERYKGYLRDILESGGHVLSLVNDLLDLAKISSGRGDLALGSLDLNVVTRQGVDITGPLAARERAILRTSLTPGLPRILADERSIRQVVLNLLSNAIRFTGPGGHVIVSTAANDQGHVTLRVRDTGPGMNPAEIEAALMPFRQVTATRRGDGTGLGLPLSKALVEANGGSFTIGGARGTGTLVEVRLPMATSAAAKVTAAAAE